METTATQPRPRRERPKAMKLSDAAAARVRDILAKSDGQYQGIRVGVTNGGCAGMSYTMDYAESAAPLEEVVEDKGVKIFIDPKAILFLIGTEMDFVRDKLARALRLQQPEPDGRLRLRRVGVDHAGDGRRIVCVFFRRSGRHDAKHRCRTRPVQRSRRICRQRASIHRSQSARFDGRSR